MTKEELRNEYNKNLHDMDKYEGYYDYQASNYVEWLEDRIIKYENGLDLIMSDDSDRVREFINEK